MLGGDQSSWWCTGLPGFSGPSLASAQAADRKGLLDDDPSVNHWGSANALGHPLCTMCIGVGQGIAVVVERV